MKKKINKIDNKIYYGIFDRVTSEGLSDYPNYKWNATMDGGGFYLFETLDKAVIACYELTKSFRKHQKDCQIEWHIVEIKQVIKVNTEIDLVKIIKED